MKTFKQFIEKNLPKSADLQKVAGDSMRDHDDVPELEDGMDEWWSTYFNKLTEWLDGDSGPTIQKFFADWLNNIPEKYRKGGKLYRAYGWLTGQPYENDFAKIMDQRVIQPNLVASWTTDLKWAKNWVYNKKIGIVIVRNVPSYAVALRLKDFVFNREIIKIGAAATGDEFWGLDYAKRESEVMVTSDIGETKFVDKYLAYLWYKKKAYKKFKDFKEAYYANF